MRHAWTWLCLPAVECRGGKGRRAGGVWEGRMGGEEREAEARRGGKLQQKQSISPANCSSPKTRSNRRIHNAQSNARTRSGGDPPSKRSNQDPWPHVSPFCHTRWRLQRAQRLSTPLRVSLRRCTRSILCISTRSICTRNPAPGCVTPLIRPSADASGAAAAAAAARVRMTCMKSGLGDGMMDGAACVRCAALPCPALPTPCPPARPAANTVFSAQGTRPRLD